MRLPGFLLIVALCGCKPVSETPQRVSPTQPQCDFVNYHHDESVNVQGPGRCTTDCDCDGMRSCSNGVCAGEARPIAGQHCNDPSYRWNEAWNGGGDGVCATDCECDRSRHCVNGHCANGAARAGDTALTR